MGNVWNIHEEEYSENGKFYARNFFKQMAVGTGVGVRYDMGMFVIRLDWGLGLHLPYETGKNGFYNIHRFKDSHSFHFAVGYPFQECQNFRNTRISFCRYRQKFLQMSKIIFEHRIQNVVGVSRNTVKCFSEYSKLFIECYKTTELLLLFDLNQKKRRKYSGTRKIFSTFAVGIKLSTINKINNMKPTLLLLAAGMGSRYGGLKQLDGLGPNGETIMDYSIYDAIQAGFGKIVFVIRKDFEDQFREKILSKYEGHIPAELCFQSLDALPEGFSVPEGREKPWGTNHAVLMAKDVINEPFCVINCDDFYNRDCFMVIGKFLSELPEGSKNRYAMVGFRVGNTLSDNGTVARGICSKDADENLTTCVERTEIMRIDGKVSYKDEE